MKLHPIKEPTKNCFYLVHQLETKRLLHPMKLLASHKKNLLSENKREGGVTKTKRNCQDKASWPLQSSASLRSNASPDNLRLS